MGVNPSLWEKAGAAAARNIMTITLLKKNEDTFLNI
jgi:hypothetical protein